MSDTLRKVSMLKDPTKIKDIFEAASAPISDPSQLDHHHAFSKRKFLLVKYVLIILLSLQLLYAIIAFFYGVDLMGRVREIQMGRAKTAADRRAVDYTFDLSQKILVAIVAVGGIIVTFGLVSTFIDSLCLIAAYGTFSVIGLFVSWAVLEFAPVPLAGLLFGIIQTMLAFWLVALLAEKHHAERRPAGQTTGLNNENDPCNV